jgi:plastocyanin
MRTRRFRIITAVLSLSLLASPSLGASHVVRANGDEWQPEVRKIVKGDLVRWTNPTNKNHDVRSIGNKWNYYELLSPDETAKKRFKSVGRYRYRCTLHSAMVDGQCQGMCGLIVVKRP